MVPSSAGATRLPRVAEHCSDLSGSISAMSTKVAISSSAEQLKHDTDRNSIKSSLNFESNETIRLQAWALGKERSSCCIWTPPMV